MISYIPAKSTKYKGIMYRSRLEATWAVFFDNYFDDPYRVTYEDFRDANGVDIRTKPLWDRIAESQMRVEIKRYTPDFRIAYHDAILFLDIKPLNPNYEYLTKLRILAAGIGIMENCLALLVGSLRDESPIFHDFPFWSSAGSPIDKIFNGSTYTSAYNVARNFRWDLYKG